MSNELTDVRCPCGAEFQADSYDAGFIAGSGMCQNCDAALPPKDICTCPSGDGSLRHPCPAHPAVEKSGGDERAAFEYWASDEGIYPKAVERSGNCYKLAQTQSYWMAWQARASLAQPSPASDLDPLNLAPHVEAFNEAPAEALKPEQAEAERPEVVARVVHSNPVVLDQCGPLNANDELMTVAQHAASVARWAEMFNRVEQERDAALAEVERLRQLERICEGLPQDAIDGGWTVQGIRGYAKRLEDQLKVAQARVAELTATRNRYGVDAHYFNKNLQRILRDFESFTPDELARSLIILAKVADEKVVAQAQHSVPDDVETFLDEVRAELLRARSKFPGDRIMTIALAEEFGELCKAVLDEPAANVRKEAVQTAVMAARVVLDGDGSVTAWRAERGLDPLAAAPGKEGL